MRILFIDFSTKLESVNDLVSRGRGGMVTSLFKVSDALSQFGHDVSVFSDIKRDGITDAGVVWLGTEGTEIKTYGVKKDFYVHVCKRGNGDGYARIKAKHRVLWTHDLPHNGFARNPDLFGAFSRVVFMSRYAERVWRTFFRQIGKSVIIPNGVDKEIFKPTSKSHGMMIYCSAPNRGLSRLPLIYEALKHRVSNDLTMMAFSNMAKLHPNEVRDEVKDGFSLAYKDCRESGIDLRDPVPQTELAKHLSAADLMIIPTDYPEICSNIILQSLACGTPVITTGGLGSAEEWVKHGRNGMLTQFHPVDYMVYTVEMVRNAVSVLENRDRLNRMQRAAAKTKIFTWQKIGAQWNKMLRKLS